MAIRPPIPYATTRVLMVEYASPTRSVVHGTVRHTLLTGIGFYDDKSGGPTAKSCRSRNPGIQGVSTPGAGSGVAASAGRFDSAWY